MTASSGAPRCDGRRGILSFLTHVVLARCILAHPGLPTEPPPVTTAVVVVDEVMGVALELDDTIVEGNGTANRESLTPDGHGGVPLQRV